MDAKGKPFADGGWRVHHITEALIWGKQMNKIDEIDSSLGAAHVLK